MIAVGTVKGGIGATTIALAVSAALAEGHPTVLVEADPSGGSLAGTSPVLHPAPSLEAMTVERRARASIDLLMGCTQQLGDVRVAPCPAEPFRAHLVVGQPRSPWIETLRELDAHVVCDVGRIHPASPAWPVLHAADAVLLVASTSPMSVAATAEWATQLGRVAPGIDGLAVDTVRLLVVATPATGRLATSPSDLTSGLGRRLAGYVPWEPASVDLLYRGAALRHRSLRRTGLAGAAHAVATSLLVQAAAA